MNPKCLIAIPVLTESVADKCLHSIMPGADILVIDNSKDRFAQKYSNLQVVDNGGVNIGLPASWNIAIRKVLDEGYDYLIFCSASNVFGQGCSDLLRYLRTEAPTFGCTTGQPAWHLVVLSRRTLEIVGLFDENFFPSYQDDTDYIYRMKLAGIHDRYSPEDTSDPRSVRLPIFNVDCSSQGNALSISLGGIEVDHEAHQEYYRKKWGGWDGEELWTMPFGDPTLSIKDWPEVAV